MKEIEPGGPRPLHQFLDDYQRGTPQAPRPVTIGRVVRQLLGQPVWKQGEILRRWRIPPEAKLP
jgi:hypothetical protein